jgi:hypothetical protein
LNKNQERRKEINAPDCPGFAFVYKAHPPVRIRICAGGCNAVDGRQDKQDGVCITATIYACEVAEVETIGFISKKFEVVFA